MNYANSIFFFLSFFFFFNFKRTTFSPYKLFWWLSEKSRLDQWTIAIYETALYRGGIRKGLRVPLNFIPGVRTTIIQRVELMLPQEPISLVYFDNIQSIFIVNMYVAFRLHQFTVVQKHSWMKRNKSFPLFWYFGYLGFFFQTSTYCTIEQHILKQCRF